MPLLSAFTECGMLECTSVPSHAENIYGSLTRSYGGNFDVAPGSRADAHCYAQAMGLARVRYALERAGRQDDPREVVELLPEREREHGLTPGPLDTIAQRQGALAARQLIPLGPTRINVTNGLRDLLGADFVAYRPTPDAEAVVFPTNPTLAPVNFQLPDVPLKVVRITSAIALPGTFLPVAYESLGLLAPGSAAPTILVGDVLIVDPGASGLEDKVTVTATGTGTFTAVFQKAHSAGTIATTQPFPAWQSTRRHSLIVLTPTAARNPVKRDKVHDFMRRIARGVSTWDIVETSAPGVAGPFRVGQGLIGITPIGTLTL